MRVFAIFGVALALPVLASAQSFGSLGSAPGAAFSLSVSPQYPAPYGEAIVSLVSSSIDLTRASLAVLVDGKETYRGAVRSFTVPLGKAGSVTTVKATVTLDGVSVSETVQLHPQDVVLIAEPVSSAPPLYPGKAGVPLGGKTRVVALTTLRDAAGKIASPAAYSYAWVVDGVRASNASGIGKSALMVDSPLEYRTREVAVTVTSGGGTLVGGASFSLAAETPVVRVYEQDALLGVRFERAVAGSYAIRDAEASLYAAPFSLPTSNGAPLVEWFLNGEAAQTGSSITLRPTGGGAGEASLSVTASAGEAAKAFQSLSLTFGGSGGSFFGL